MSASRREHTAAAAASIFLAAAVLAGRSAAAADDPRAWLDRMARAIDELNYAGDLVHVHGGDTSVMRIVHRVEDGRVTERITSEDAEREIIRTDDTVTCIFPDQRTVLVEERDAGDAGGGSPLRAHLPGAGGLDAALYHVAFAGAERVAGRKTLAIAIRPKDGFRYGYRIWLDEQTALPLHTQLVDEAGNTMEQVRFTDIELPGTIPDSAVRPSVSTESFAVRRSPSPAAPADGPLGADWGAAELPPGFRLSVRQARVSPDARAGLRHLVYSDGLATVSLFIEPAVAASEQAEGLSQIGAANAYTTTVDGHMITAVGDVPARTVELLARSARPPAQPGR